MVASAGHLGHQLALQGPLDQRGRVALRRGTVSQLTVAVVSPVKQIDKAGV